MNNTRRFLPSLVVAAAVLCLPSSISFLVIPLAFPLLLAGWALGRQREGGHDLWRVLGIMAIILLGVVTAWLWFTVDPYAEEPAHIDMLFRIVASATAGYLVCGLTFFLLRRRRAARS
ncbi:MAG: hypothetical protein Q4D89_07275 [Arachnia propionica]|uniref:hypothetical protein n=1 Tax=Arachnia propionica TaxID=1750 RepID=UPI0026F7A1B9|nr:hypothetical protein [Arachnia propionica]